MRIQIEKAVELVTKALISNGVKQDEAEIIIEHLLEEEMIGKSSHGFYRIPSIIRSYKKTESKIMYTNRFKSCVEVDGCGKPGLVVAQKATDQITVLCKENPIALVAAKGYKGTTGAMGYYARKLANDGLMSIIMCTSEYAVAPWGGKDAILGTNPICFGFPKQEENIIIDFATSARTYGELMLSVNKNETVPYGIVLDSKGNPSNNPNDANDGCQLPMAEHKGYGLGLAIEILSGVFIGAKAGKDAVTGTDGLIIIAIRPDIFTEAESYFNNLNKLSQEILNSELATGFNEIRIPGDSFTETYKHTHESGVIDLDDIVINRIKELIINE